MTPERPSAGDRFDTSSERGCIALTPLIDDGFETPYFWGLDSDGVRCSFIPAQVTRWERREARDNFTSTVEAAAAYERMIGGHP
jgi:hypothetical protein